MPIRRDSFLANVQERGEYATTEEADRVARVILALLGAHLVGTVRAELAARLPETYALILLNPLQAAEPLSPERFVRATAAWIEGATEKTALWDIGAVLSTAASTAGDDLTREVLLQLPPATTSSSAPPTPPDLSPVRTLTAERHAQPCTTSLERTPLRRP